MSELIQFDYQLFHLINSGCQNAFFDFAMPILRNKYTWAPFYLFLLVFLVANFSRKGIWLCVALAVTVTVTDSVNSQVLKKNIMRLRPCKVMEQPKDMYLLVPCGSGYSFPSTHAANHFGMAVLLCLTLGRLYRWLIVPLLLWALSVGFAQVYVGLHFPLDIAGGAIFGSAVAWGVFLLFDNWIVFSKKAQTTAQQAE